MGKKILIADDEPDMMKVLHFRLQKAGFTMVVAVNGVEALEAFEREKPDLVLLDFRMPLMTGDEVCRRLKADEASKGTPVIFMSASSERLTAEMLMSYGADDYVVKPFDYDDLLMKIQRQLEKK